MSGATLQVLESPEGGDSAIRTKRRMWLLMLRPATSHQAAKALEELAGAITVGSLAADKRDYRDSTLHALLAQAVRVGEDLCP